MALVPIDDSQYVVAVTPDDSSVGLWIDPGGQSGGVDQIGIKDCQPADLTVFGRRRQKVLGVDVVAVDSQYLAGEQTGGRSVSLRSGAQRLIKQFIDAGRPVRLAHSANETSTVSSSVLVSIVWAVTWPV